MTESQVSVVTAKELHEMMTSSHQLKVIHVTENICRPEYMRPSAEHLSIRSIDVFEHKDNQPSRVSGNYSLKDFNTLSKIFGSIGIDPKVRCIVYEGGESCKSQGKNVSADPILSARLCWCLSLLGVKHVSILLGGLRLWCELQLPIVSKSNTSVVYEKLNFNTAGIQNPQYYADTKEVYDFVKQRNEELLAPIESDKSEKKSKILIDVRSWKEFSGEGHDYPYFLPLGRIPFSTWLNWGPSTYYGGILADAKTGVLRGKSTMESVWSDANIPLKTDTRLIFYCGSGWRSSLAWFIARLAGHENCANYDGGFMEYGWLDGNNYPMSISARNDTI